jgi:para-aminobenzoate synthetase/4-amino-4-deoxychorismate lyase
MVSKITGKLNKKVNLGEIIKNIFPCGSITGAPKIRTMEIIRELEKQERGIYTGTIGLIGKKSSVFNVAIRTIKIEKSSGKGEMGLGSGIVWDSDADNEYIETMLKSEFLTSPLKPFELIETMLVENGEIYLFDKHIERLRNSSEFFMFVFNEKDFARSLLKLARKKYSEGKYKLRVTLDKWGKVNYESSILNPLPEEINLIISNEKISSANVLQYYKTTNRDLYSREYEKYSTEGYFDVIFFNEREELAEGSTTNIFVKINNEWFTPMQSCGILPGIYRNLFIQNGNAREERITIDDLLGAEEVTIVNSVRKEIKVNRIQYGNEFIEYPT